jgi:hypothetical protein
MQKYAGLYGRELLRMSRSLKAEGATLDRVPASQLGDNSERILDLSIYDSNMKIGPARRCSRRQNLTAAPQKLVSAPLQAGRT